jgi:hypothetical protein
MFGKDLSVKSCKKANLFRAFHGAKVVEKHFGAKEPNKIDRFA